MHSNAAKSMVMHLGTKKIACICRVGGFNLRVPWCLKRAWMSGWKPATCEPQLCVAECGPWLYLWGMDCCSHTPYWWHDCLDVQPLSYVGTFCKRIIETRKGLRKVLQKWLGVCKMFIFNERLSLVKIRLRGYLLKLYKHCGRRFMVAGGFLN